MKKILLYLFFLSFFLPSAAVASVFSVSVPQDVGVGDQFIVTVYLNTEGERINAISGVVIANEKISLKEVREQGTSVTLWIEKPTIEKNTIYFSGIIPGGVEGTRAPVFSVVFEAVKRGQAEIRFSGLMALKNDGEGSEDKVTALKADMVIGSAKVVPSLVSDIRDTTPPVEFVPIISRSTELFDDKWFISFATQDKETGVSHYEVSERTFPWQKERWVETQSPKVLKSQRKWGFVSVKAVDGGDNERVIRLSPEAGIFHYPNYAISIIIIIILLALYFIKYFKKWRKDGRQK